MPILNLPRTVVVLSLVSFLNDLASDMVIPLIPILLATVLSAGPIALGLVEGIADAVASFLKLWSGRQSDWLGGRRKGLTASGYALSNIARPLLGLAGSWVAVLALRSIDRIGKGIRSAPRDAMIADVTPPPMRGMAFGFHRALDNGGAVGGALAAAAVLNWSSLSLSQVMLWSAIPGALGVLLILLAVKEPGVAMVRELRPPRPELRWTTLSAPMRRYLLVLVVFTFARASETFIVLRGHELGMSVPLLLVLWAALNLSKALTNTWGGGIADRMGRQGVMLLSWVAYGACYLALGFVIDPAGLWAVTLAYGAFAGISEGAERAVIDDFAVVNERGTAFGWYNMMLGVASIPAGLAFGMIWNYWTAVFAFVYAGVMALLAAAMLHYWVARMRPAVS
jgi:MFS family permease